MDLSIRISPDLQSAVLDLPAGAFVELPQLKQLLSKGEIRSGLHREALVSATHAADQDRTLVLASGEPPVPGYPGGLTPPLDPATLPRKVRAGEDLGIWQPPAPASPGMGVDGSVIPAPPDPPPLRLGRGLLADEQGRVTAERDGELLLEPDGTLRVSIPGLVERERGDVIVQIDTKGLEARIVLAPGEYVSAAKMETVLAKAAVTTGIDAEAVARAARTETGERTLVLARGVAPQHGADARIELLIDDHLHFRVDDFDRMDYHDLGKAREVAPGTPLARLHPATPGTPGKSVRGHDLPAKPGRDLALDPLVGEGTRVSVVSPGVLEATVVGVYRRTRRGKLQVHPLLTIDGDIDLKSGNIDTTLPVLIKGDIKAGFIVKSAADIQVMGVIEDARVSAQGNLLVRGGILPGHSRVKAHGKVVARYITGREVKGHDIEVLTSIRYSRILATGNVTAKEIIAGRLIAGGNVSCDMLGSEDEQRTLLQVGINPYDEALFLAAQQGQGRLGSEVVRLKERCKLLAHKISAHSQPAGAEDPFAADLRQALQDFSAACTRLAECEAVIARHSELLADTNRASAGSTVIVRGTAHPGVEVLIGELAKVELRAPLAGPMFRYHEGAVTWS
jgi:hypothetical protein